VESDGLPSNGQKVEQYVAQSVASRLSTIDRYVIKNTWGWECAKKVVRKGIHCNELCIYCTVNKLFFYGLELGVSRILFLDSMEHRSYCTNY